MSKISFVEALADCIQRFEGWKPPYSNNAGTIAPGSTSWRNRNPGNLRNSIYQNSIDDKGYAVFSSLASGWIGLTRDLSVKVNGQSTHKLTPQSTLHDLFTIYAPALDNNDPTQYTKQIARWLNDIYNTNTISPMSKLEDLVKLGSS